MNSSFNQITENQNFCDDNTELILGIVAGVTSLLAILSECIGVSKCKKNSVVEFMVVKKLLKKKESEKELELV